MEKDLKFTKSQLGLFDTALFLPYALVQVFKTIFVLFKIRIKFFSLKDVFWSDW